MFIDNYFTTLLNRNYSSCNTSSANTCAKRTSANISGNNLRSTSSPFKCSFSVKKFRKLEMNFHSNISTN